MRRVEMGQRQEQRQEQRPAPTLCTSGGDTPLPMLRGILALPATSSALKVRGASLIIHTCAPIRPPGPARPSPRAPPQSPQPQPRSGGRRGPARPCLRAVRTGRPGRPEFAPTPHALPRERGRAEGSGWRLPLLPPPRGPLGWSGGGAGQRGPGNATPEPGGERSPGEAGSDPTCGCQRGAVQAPGATSQPPPRHRRDTAKLPVPLQLPLQGHRSASGAT